MASVTNGRMRRRSARTRRRSREPPRSRAAALTSAATLARGCPRPPLRSRAPRAPARRTHGRRSASPRAPGGAPQIPARYGAIRGPAGAALLEVGARRQLALAERGREALPHAVVVDGQDVGAAEPEDQQHL